MISNANSAQIQSYFNVVNSGAAMLNNDKLNYSLIDIFAHNGNAGNTTVNS